MRRNRIWSLVLVMAAVSLTACGGMENVTEEQTDLIAEYSAGVLLRYSDRYERRLITKEQRGQEEVQQTTATSEPVVSPTAEATAKPLTDQNGQIRQTTSSTQELEKKNTVELDELFGLEGVSVVYDSYWFTKRYGQTQIRAEKGKNLLVVRFYVKNLTKKKQKVDLGNKKKDEIHYELNVDGNHYEPGLNMLENGGLNYLTTTIPAGKKEEAVLIYSMDEEKKQASSIQLTIQKGDEQSVVLLK